ncbi:MAG TPA: hypothetical protein VMY88_12740 [Acidimicrobiales bacterium]|nr:hypothetical protein [Acidimicrobiales bacterium]
MTLDTNVTGPNVTNGSNEHYNHGDDDEVTFYEESEARRGTGTSEFWVYLFGVVTLLFFTYENGRDSLSRDDGWRYVAFMTIAYLVSRGLAKAGSSEPRLRRRSL